MSSRTYRSATYDAAPDVEPWPPHDSPGRRGGNGRPADRRTGKGNGRTKTGKRRRDPLWARLCVIFGALLMMGSGGVIVGGKVLLSQATSSVQQQNLLGEAGITHEKGTAIKGAINILLVGIDVRAGQQDDSVRADTIVILHIPPSHDQAFLISIPRDTRVTIPDYPKSNFRGWTTKINAAFQGGYQGPGTPEEKRARGVELLGLTIKKLIPGMQFRGAAIIDFQGFEAVLRELGGVHLCIEHEATSIHYARDQHGNLMKVWATEDGVIQGLQRGWKPVVHKPGCQDMSAELALDYSRIRKGSCCPNGDYDRQKHQRQLLKAIAKKAVSRGVLTDPPKLLRVIDAAGKAFILDTQGVAIEDFLFTLKGVTANDLTLVKTNAGRVNPAPGGSDELLTQDSVDMLAAVRDGRLMSFLATHQDFWDTAS